jgi:hypothetical protein
MLQSGSFNGYTTPQTALEVNHLLQHDAKTWECLLWTSGRLLNLTKCLYYVSLGTCDDEGRASLTPKMLLPQLTLTSGNSPLRVPVSQYNYDAAHKYLGNQMAPNLQMTTAYQQLLERDSCLMEVISSLPGLARAQAIAFNCIRLFFGVYYLSELATADGSEISRGTWDGSRPRFSALLWPYQPRPGPKTFRI